MLPSFAPFAILLLAAALFVGIATPGTLEGVEGGAGTSRWLSALAGAGTLVAVAFIAFRTTGRARVWAASASVLVLSSTPLFFLHARASTGVAVAEAALVLSFLLTTVRHRSLALALSALAGGLVFAAAGSGALAMVPVLALALCTRSRLRWVVCSIWMLTLARETQLTGVAWDTPVAQLIHSAFPWVFALPMLALHVPKRHTQVVIATCLALVVHVLVRPNAPFVGVSLLALWLGTLPGTWSANRARVPFALSLAGLALMWLTARDLTSMPDKPLASFGVIASAALPMWIARVALVPPVVALFVRGRAVSFAIAAALGLWMRWADYPALLAHLSTAEAIFASERMVPKGEAFGVFGLTPPKGARTDGKLLRSDQEAASFLAQDTASWIALGSPQLASLNALYRKEHSQNLPVAFVSDRSMLVGNVVAKSINPLDAVVQNESPPLTMRASRAVGDAIVFLGWSLARDDGTALSKPPGRKFHLRAFYKVVSPVSGGYCTFIHVDHTPTRFSKEHMEHRYPMQYWQAGDVIMDDFDVDLGATFGKGAYPAYLGFDRLPCDGSARMRVPDTSDNRIPAGMLEIP
jgi:hypothetical protein